MPTNITRTIISQGHADAMEWLTNYDSCIEEGAGASTGEHKCALLLRPLLAELRALKTEVAQLHATVMQKSEQYIAERKTHEVTISDRELWRGNYEESVKTSDQLRAQLARAVTPGFVSDFHEAWGYAKDHSTEHTNGYQKASFMYVQFWLEKLGDARRAAALA